MATPAEYDLFNTFDVLVGERPHQTPFTVYFDILTTRSEFFRRERSFPWMANPRRPTLLPDVDPDDFERYLKCAMWGPESFWPPSRDNGDAESVKKVANEKFLCLTRLYVLADRFQDLQTANAIIDQIVVCSEESSQIPGFDPVTFAYGATTPRSPLRSLFRDYWVYEAAPHSVDDLKAKSFPAEFYCDVAHECLQITNRVIYERVEHFHPFKLRIKDDLCAHDKCSYHQHNDRHPRCP